MQRENKVQCHLCDVDIDVELDGDAFYPLMGGNDEDGDYEESDYEDTPFCSDCSDLKEKEILIRLDNKKSFK